MSEQDDDYLERVANAGPVPYHERFELHRNARGELGEIVDKGPESADPAAEPEQAPDGEPRSIDDRLATVEAVLAPMATEEQRQEQLERMQQQADRAFEMEPRELAMQAAEAARLRTMDELGVMPRPATMEDTLAAGEEIASAHVDNWAEVRDAVFSEMTERPQWLTAVNANPDAATLGQTFVSIASTLAQAETAKQHSTETRRQAQTLSGGGARPATQTDDQAYWERVKNVDTGSYGG